MGPSLKGRKERPRLRFGFTFSLSFSCHRRSGTRDAFLQEWNHVAFVSKYLNKKKPAEGASQPLHFWRGAGGQSLPFLLFRDLGEREKC